MEAIISGAETATQSLIGFLAWLGIQPSMQDAVKAIILVLFVLATLMVVGDVYRGEIQNKLHRIILVPSSKGASLPPEQRSTAEARRRLRKEKDIVCHVPQTLVSLTMSDIHSDVLFYFRYRDHMGRLRSKLVETYRVRFHVKRNSHSHALAAGHERDHAYTTDEEDLLSDEDGRTIVTMAASRVDYINIGKVEPVLAAETKRYEALQRKGIGKLLADMKGSSARPPEALGLAVKFHFPIDPHFLLYKHPDTNVRTTAWLTVLTSVFALFMQLIYSSGTSQATAAPVDPPAVVRSVSSQ